MKIKTIGMVVALATLFASLSALAAPEWWHSSVAIDNESHFAIHHLYLTESHKDKWGKDWLGSDPLEKGEKVTITGLECESYDLKLVDNDGDVCVVSDINLCLEDASWKMTDVALAVCQAFTK
jgi:hypothetical protein